MSREIEYWEAQRLNMISAKSALFKIHDWIDMADDDWSEGSYEVVKRAEREATKLMGTINEMIGAYTITEQVGDA